VYGHHTVTLERRASAVRALRADQMLARAVYNCGIHDDRPETREPLNPRTEPGTRNPVAGTTLYSGMLPCFFGGFLSRLFSQMAEAAISLVRVFRGWMTSSMNSPRREAAAARWCAPASW